MMALTLNDPHSALVMVGAKGVESRGWKYPPYVHQARIAVHSSKGFRREDVELFHRPDVYAPLLAAGFDHFGALPRGCIVATVRLVACVRAEEVVEMGERAELGYGDYGAGRWGWMMAELVRLPAPVPCRGFQKLWKLPADVLARIPREAL